MSASGLGCRWVSLHYFDYQGRLIVLPGSPKLLGPGAMGSFGSPTSERLPGSRLVWGVLVSDQDILPTVTFENDRDSGSRAFQVEAHPADCREPAGYEFVCQFARSEED